MRTTAKRAAPPSAKRFILLDSTRDACKRLGAEETFRVRKVGELGEALRNSTPESTWIVMRSLWVEPLVGAVCSHFMQNKTGPALGDLLMVEPPRSELIPSLHGQFRRVVGEVPSFRMLPSEQLMEVLASATKPTCLSAGLLTQAVERLR